jgi:hypothetical protein
MHSLLLLLFTILVVIVACCLFSRIDRVYLVFTVCSHPTARKTRWEVVEGTTRNQAQPVVRPVAAGSAAANTMRSPLLTALGAGTGTFVAMSVVTGLVSAATLKVAKQVVHHRKVRPLLDPTIQSKQGSATARLHCCLACVTLSLQMKVATQCLACDGVGYLRCQVCMGEQGLHAGPGVAEHMLVETPHANVWPCNTSYQSPATCCLLHHLPLCFAGKGIVRCRQPVPMRLLRRQKPPAAGDPSRAPVMCSCPACGTTRTQRCLNCVGEGKLCLPS